MQSIPDLPCIYLSKGNWQSTEGRGRRLQFCSLYFQYLVAIIKWASWKTTGLEPPYQHPSKGLLGRRGASSSKRLQGTWRGSDSGDSVAGKPRWIHACLPWDSQRCNSLGSSRNQQKGNSNSSSQVRDNCSFAFFFLSQHRRKSERKNIQRPANQSSSGLPVEELVRD